MHPTIEESSKNLWSCHDPELNLKMRGVESELQSSQYSYPGHPCAASQCIQYTVLEEDEQLLVSVLVSP